MEDIKNKLACIGKEKKKIDKEYFSLKKKYDQLLKMDERKNLRERVLYKLKKEYPKIDTSLFDIEKTGNIIHINYCNDTFEDISLHFYLNCDPFKSGIDSNIIEKIFINEFHDNLLFEIIIAYSKEQFADFFLSLFKRKDMSWFWTDEIRDAILDLISKY